MTNDKISVLGKALAEMMTLEQKSRDFGFDWPHHEMILEQVLSECQEVREVLEHGESRDRLQEEIGDLIHTALSLCAFSGFDVQETLSKTNDKFAARLEALQKITHGQGLEDLRGQSAPFMLSLWKEAKRQAK